MQDSPNHLLEEAMSELKSSLDSVINDLGWIANELGVDPDMAQVINRIRALKEIELRFSCSSSK